MVLILRLSLGFAFRVAALTLFALVAVAAEAPKDKKARLREKIKNVLPAGGWEVQAPKDALKESSFSTHKGQYCIVKTTVGGEASREIALFIDLYFQFFQKIFTRKFTIPPPFKIVVFAHGEEFKAYYYRLHPSQQQTPRNALYSPGTRETWVVLLGEGERKRLPLETAKHELTHHILHFFTGQTVLPPWFNEGAACFFQYWDVVESPENNIARNLEAARGGDFGYFPAIIKKEFGGKRFLAPHSLMKLDFSAFHCADPDLERLHYSESWALVNFLTTTNVGQKFFDMILTAIREGKKVDGLLNAKSMESLKDAWFADIRKRMVSA